MTSPHYSSPLANHARKRRNSLLDYNQSMQTLAVPQDSPAAGRKVLRRRSSAPPASLAYVPARRANSVLNDCSDSSVTRAMYHFAREHMNAVRQQGDECQGSRCKRVFAAMRFASRAVIMTNSVVKGMFDSMSDRRLLDAKRAEDCWNALMKFSDNVEGSERHERMISALLGELLEDVEGAAGLRKTAANMVCRLKGAEEALRRLHAAYVVQFHGYEEMHRDIDRCAAEAMRLVAIFEGSVGDVRRCLRSPAVIESLRLPAPCEEHTAGSVQADEDPKAAETRASILKNLEKDLCDRPVELLQGVAHDIMSSHLASGITELPCIAEINQALTIRTNSKDEAAEGGAADQTTRLLQEADEDSLLDKQTTVRQRRQSVSTNLMQALGVPFAPLEGGIPKRRHTVLGPVDAPNANLRKQTMHRASLPASIGMFSELTSGAAAYEREDPGIGHPGEGQTCTGAETKMQSEVDQEKTGAMVSKEAGEVQLDRTISSSRLASEALASLPSNIAVAVTAEAVASAVAAVAEVSAPRRQGSGSPDANTAFAPTHGGRQTIYGVGPEVPSETGVKLPTLCVAAQSAYPPAARIETGPRLPKVKECRMSPSAAMTTDRFFRTVQKSEVRRLEQKEATNPPLRVQSLPLLRQKTSTQDTDSQMTPNFSNQLQAGLWRVAGVPESGWRPSRARRTPHRQEPRACSEPSSLQYRQMAVRSKGATKQRTGLPLPAAKVYELADSRTSQNAPQLLPCLLLQRHACADDKSRKQPSTGPKLYQTFRPSYNPLFFAER
eukprot:gb/GFBE01013539.1/.p1 GENE.gb/GFBE01013539.1/~~gb/GFBE01013539.1/.p1  ORF type:complete len:781 (+),score=113.85 gb/GFBE01013539.1/:1-2343(+)